MFFLTGLLGMMALGSIAVLGTTSPDDDMADEDEQSSRSLSHEVEPEFDDGMGEGSLFAQMGLLDPDIDAAEDDMAQPVVEEADPASEDDEVPLAAPGAAIAEALRAPEPGLTEIGGPDEDTIVGTEQDDFLAGGDGDDSILGAGGADGLSGGAGLDTLDGGDGADTLHGESGDDLIRGGGGTDTLYGYDGNDVLHGGTDRDSLEGGLGNDLIDGGDGDDALHGREGADTMTGGLGADTLFGGWNNDVLIGVERDATGQDVDAADYLNGGDGDDVLVAGNGDVVGGGTGYDTVVLGDWITDAAAELWDFDAAEDKMVIVYDDSDGATDPELEIRVLASDPSLTEIVVDGRVLGTVPTLGAPSPEAIALVGESFATSLQLGTI